MRRAALLCIFLIVSPRVLAQSATSSEKTSLGATFSANLLRDLPGSENLFVLLETTQPTLISDRFFGGGLYIGEPGRVGGFLGSWSQTLFRIGDVSLTDPAGGGVPLLFPDLMLWEKVDVATGLMPPDINAAGLAISLEPRRPSTTWTRTVHVTTSHFGTPSPVQAPPIARSDGSDRVALTASGPLIANRLGLLLAGSWTAGRQFNRLEAESTKADLGSAFAHLVFTPREHHEIAVIGWAQRASTPFAERTAFRQPDQTTVETAGHVQASWQHDGIATIPWRAFAGYTGRHRDTGVESLRNPHVERLLDGPVSALASLSDGNVYQWSLGGRVMPSPARRLGLDQKIEIGLDAFGAQAQSSSFFSGDATEAVDGYPARLWRFANPGTESIRHEIGFSAYLSDRLTLGSKLHIDAAIRYDAVSGSAVGAATDIRWKTPLPRASIRWTIADAWKPTLVAGYSRSAYRLPLDLLAVGDPAAPIADVFRWDAPRYTATFPTSPGPLVTRAGPGTGGDPAFSAIDDQLRRPRSDEVVAGIEIHPGGSLRLGVIGVARRERDFVGLVNKASPSYSVFGLFDPGGDLLGTEDDRIVPVYNRTRESFGRDQYLLTNPGQREATFNGVEVDIALTRERLMLSLGATAGRAVGSAANRGIGPLENDQSLIGELTTDPNAATFARGRVFNDRAYTAKLIGVYKLPLDLTLGAVARYQDGQPFARLLVLPALNQGAEAVRAFANGDSRFTYIATLDARLQKGFTVGARRFDIVLDVYNVTNLANSVDESTTELPDVRLTTAVQPPRTIQLGLRATF